MRRAVERDRASEMTARPAADDCRRLVVPGRVDRAGAGSVVEAVRSAQARARDTGVADRDHDRRGGRRVAGAVASYGSERAAAVQLAARVPDHRVRASGVLGSDVVPVGAELNPRDSLIVGRVRSHGDEAAQARTSGGRRDRNRRRRRVRRGDRRRRLVRRGADVPGSILGRDPVVVGADGKAGVGVARARRLRDPVRQRSA